MNINAEEAVDSSVAFSFLSFLIHGVDLGSINWLSITVQFKVGSSGTCSTHEQLVSQFPTNQSSFCLHDSYLVVPNSHSHRPPSRLPTTA